MTKVENVADGPQDDDDPHDLAALFAGGCPWPGGVLLNTARQQDWLVENGLVTVKDEQWINEWEEKTSAPVARWTARGAAFARDMRIGTVLQAQNKRIYTKQFIQGRYGPEAMDAKPAFLHRVHLVWLETVRDIETALVQLEKASNCCVIRGAPAVGTRLSGAVRRLYVESDKPVRSSRIRDEIERGTFQDCWRAWLCIDIDDLVFDVPQELWSELDDDHRAGCTLETDPLKAAVDLLDGMARPEFRGVRSVIQLSSSTGLKKLGPGKKCGIHWWLALDREWTSAELRAWAHAMLDQSKQEVIDGEEDGEPVSPFSLDPALYSAVQVHYTASPILPENVDDIERIAVVELPDHMAAMFGVDSIETGRGYLKLSEVDFGRYDWANGSGMGDARIDNLTDLIMTGTSYYPAYMPIIKHQAWIGADKHETYEWIRNMIEASPAGTRRDSRLASLEAEVGRLYSQVERSQRINKNLRGDSKHGRAKHGK